MYIILLYEKVELSSFFFDDRYANFNDIIMMYKLKNTFVVP